MSEFPAELADRLEIEEVVNRYFYAVDVRDVELIVSCFTPDVTLRYMGGKLVMQGHAEAAAYFAEKRGFATIGIEVTGSTHDLGNLYTEFTGEDQASTTSFAVAFLRGTYQGKDVLMQRGITYTDRFVRHEGRWLIRERLHAPGWVHVSEEAGS